jgi:hypothetical protein
MKEIFIAWVASHRYSACVVSVSAPAINSGVLRIVHHAPVIHTVKQIVKLLSKKYAEM